MAAAPTVGWIGTGRMGYQLALRLLKAGYDVGVYNRTRAKCEPLSAHGAKIVDRPVDLADRDIVVIMVSADADLEAVISGEGGLLTGTGDCDVPKIIVDSSTVSLESSARIRAVVESCGGGVPGRPGQREPQGDRGGQTHRGRLRPARGVRRGRAAAGHVRPRRHLRRRGRGAPGWSRSRTTCCSAS